ncbi:MAG: flagellar filament capping protein FliD [Terracidiphilus sp.]|jgi:flagellar hook-associated protein 2
MGTVGLSFGSPTSGTGFDVSTTVASIVSNLQAVETPWKSQLTTLESQDTVISSLGTLFSNLSNDMSSLTDFEGIMAEKTGSSSDTNVLTLTYADSTAIAGTHTVEVANLAETSSGYLAEVPSASTPLTGSITLQAGSGTAQTITLTSSDNTLSGLASAINSSGAGITASVLTDSSGSRLSLVSGTSGADGNITVSDNSIGAALSYTASSGSSSSGTLGEIAASTDTLSGSITLQVGSGTAQTITLDSSDDTLSGLESVINDAGLGVTATPVTNTDGSTSLTLSSGTAGALTVTSNVFDTSSTLGYTSTVTGKDANLTVDGINLTSASNTVTDLIPGVTFQLLAPSSTGEQVQVVIGNDNSGVESTVNQFVTDYNSLISAMSTQEGNDSSGNPEPLFGSPTLSLLQQQLLGSLNTQNPNGYLDSITNSADTLTGSISIVVGSGTAQTVSLPSSGGTLASLSSAINSAGIGVTANVVTSSSGSQLVLVSNTEGSSGALTVTSSITDSTTGTALNYNNSGSDINSLTSLGISVNNDGSLTLDATSLDSTLNSDYSSVVGFFQSANSWGMSFSNMLTDAGTSSTTGILALASSSNSSMESNLNAEITKENLLISEQQTSLTAELDSANEILQELPSQLDSVNELYSAITGYNQSSS